MKRSLLTQALRISVDKLDRHPELQNFAHYSFIVQSGRILEWATNSRREPPRHYGYHHNRETTFRPKFHAEVFAYKRARGLLVGDAFEIINIRLTRAGVVRLSKPCRPCYELMTALGCRAFYYSSDFGFLKLQ